MDLVIQWNGYDHDHFQDPKTIFHFLGFFFLETNQKNVCSSVF
jgi:hypothetical protein